MGNGKPLSASRRQSSGSLAFKLTELVDRILPFVATEKDHVHAGRSQSNAYGTRGIVTLPFRLPTKFADRCSGAPGCRESALETTR
jgi:hypothetical protein